MAFNSRSPFTDTEDAVDRPVARCCLTAARGRACHAGRNTEALDGNAGRISASQQAIAEEPHEGFFAEWAFLMRRCVLAIAVMYAAMLGLAEAGIAAGRSQERAQTAAAEHLSGPDDQRVPEGSASLLQAIRAGAFARALDEVGSASKKYGTLPSFPLPSCVFENGLCGALNRDGTIALLPQFDWVGTFHEGRALVRSNGLYGYVDMAGRLVVEPQYALAGDYWRGLAEVDIGGKSALIDLEGRTVLGPKFTRALPFGVGAFWVKDGARHSLNTAGFDELVTVHDTKSLNTQFVTDGTWKLVDRTGTFIPTPEISSIKYFDLNDDKLMWAHTNSGWGLIQGDGSWLVQPKYQQIGDLVEGFAAVRLGDKWGYIDRTGTTVIQPEFSSAESFDDGGLALAKVGRFSGLIDKSGAWVIRPHYGRISRDKTDVVWVEIDGKIGAFERSGRMIVSPQFSQTPLICDDGWVIGYIGGQRRILRDVNKPLAIPTGQLSGIDCREPFQIQDGSKFGFVDRALRPITKIDFERAYLFSEHTAVVEHGGKFGYIKDDGMWLIEPRFEEAQPFRHGAAVVRLGNKLGYIKADGTWLVTPKFDEADSFEGGFAIVREGGKRGIIDARGAWVSDTRLHHIDLALGRTGLVALKSSQGKWGFVDARGALVIEQRYDEVRAFERGLSWVKQDGSWCPIGRRGQSVPTLPCQSLAPTPTLALRSWPY
jgi:hypothetical protein